MKLNSIGEPIFSTQDLINEIYKGNLEKIRLANIEYNTDIDYLSYVEFVEDNNLSDWPVPNPYFGDNKSIKEFDSSNQNNWYMPQEYKDMDIEQYLYSLCNSPVEQERVLKEIELFKSKNMINLLKFLKYLVDKMRENKIVWGVGRGSSVASYCLFLIGIHKVNSIKYNLDIKEFLK